ncbi:MAG: hypothetical protein H6746_08045 [Deltaproteobacteria bacterium]|nr:hypothetical protein [Deltaproteobacteria bacterium]
MARLRPGRRCPGDGPPVIELDGGDVLGSLVEFETSRPTRSSPWTTRFLSTPG